MASSYRARSKFGFAFSDSVSNWRDPKSPPTTPVRSPGLVNDPISISGEKFKLFAEFERKTPTKRVPVTDFDISSFKKGISRDRKCRVLFDLLNRGLQPPVEAFNILMQKYGDVGAMGAVKKIYKYILAQDIADHYTFTMLIQIAGNRGDVEFANAVYTKALEVGQYNSFTFNCMVVALPDTQQEKIHQVYEESIERKDTSPVLFTSLLTKINNKTRALQYYREAKRLDQVADSVYVSMLSCVLRLDEIPTAYAVYEDSRRAGVVGEGIIIVMLAVATKTRDLLFAQELFSRANTAAAQNSLFRLHRVNNAYLDVLFKLDQHALADNVFKEHKMELLPRKIENIYEVDLHDASYARAYLGLFQIISVLPQDSNVTLKIICGRGLHSKSNDEIHPTLRATYDFCKDIENANFIFAEMEDVSSRMGVVTVALKPKKLTQAAVHEEKIEPVIKPSTLLVAPVVRTGILFRLFTCVQRCSRSTAAEEVFYSPVGTSMTSSRP